MGHEIKPEKIKSTAQTNTIIVQFCKEPKPGEVKTRLIPQIGANKAMVLHKELSHYCLTNFLTSPVVTLELWIAGDIQHSFFQNLQTRYPQIQLQEQCGNDLGERMANACNSVFDREPQLILVGSDCPFIDAAYLQQAIDALMLDNDVVIGPAADGGYVLLGLKKFNRALFEGIDWGTAQVFKQTLAVINALQWSCFELPTLHDIDRPEDLSLLPAGVKWY